MYYDKPFHERIGARRSRRFNFRLGTSSRISCSLILFESRSGVNAALRCASVSRLLLAALDAVALAQDSHNLKSADKARSRQRFGLKDSSTDRIAPVERQT